jgi:cytidylate kinase
MSQIFTDYMSNRLNFINTNNLKNTNGPVITISRTAGCSSNSISKLLLERLNAVEGEQKWEVISKEILRESAIELKLNPNKIKTIFEAKNRNMIDEIVQTFISEDYQLEKRMIKTVSKVIHKFGSEGFKIIIGRAANCICSDIQRSLHIRIDAPLNWRIERVEKTKKLSKEVALNWIVQTEKNRASFIRSVKGKKTQSDDYDLTINQKSFSDDVIIEIILSALKSKKILGQ